MKMELVFFFFVFLSAFSSSIHSRSLEHIPETSLFNVSAAIQNAIQILTFKPETLHEHEESEESESSSTLKLYSRDILHTSSFKTYRDLTLSRLERDAVRVNNLYKKVDSKFKPNRGDVDAPVTPGSGGSGEYFARLGFGTPVKKLYTIIDTGSDITWIQCSPCTDCYKQTDPIFDPSSSSSYNLLSCDSELCQELDESSCNDQSCGYEVSYGDGSTTFGDFATETITLGKSAIKEVAVGCGHENTGLFAEAAGLLGLGLGPLSFPSQINSSAFSYCLVDRDSTTPSTLHFGSTTGSNTGVITAPLLTDQAAQKTFYYIGLTGLSVGGKKLPIPRSAFAISASGDGGVILDSGTTITRFPSEIYSVLRDEFAKQAKHLKSAPGVSILDTCYELTAAEVDVPAIGFQFGAKTLSLPSKNILIAADENVFCLAFAEFQQGSFSIIGNVQQQGIAVNYNVGKSVIGFSPDQC